MNKICKRLQFFISFEVYSHSDNNISSNILFLRKTLLKSYSGNFCNDVSNGSVFTLKLSSFLLFIHYINDGMFFFFFGFFAFIFLFDLSNTIAVSMCILSGVRKKSQFMTFIISPRSFILFCNTFFLIFYLKSGGVNPRKAVVICLMTFEC